MNQAANAEDALRFALEKHRAGALHEALRIYQATLELQPDNLEVVHLLGLAEVDSGNVEEGVARLEHAVARAPGNPAFLNSLGNGYRALGRLDEAVAMFGKALALKPDYAEPHVGLGLAHQAAGRLEDAAKSFRRAIALRPDLGLAHLHLAEVKAGEGALLEARASAQHAADLMPRDPRPPLLLGTIWGEVREFDVAEGFFRRFLELSPDNAVGYSDLGRVLRAQGRAREAETALRRALALDPDTLVAHVNLGMLHSDAGRLDEAEAAWARAAALGAAAAEPADRARGALADFNRSLARLVRGDYAAGFRLYERRFEAGPLLSGSVRDLSRGKELAHVQRWTGDPAALRGKRLMLWTEQGLGDTVMMLRYAPKLKAFGLRQLLVLCPPALQRLAAGVPGVDGVLGSGEEIEAARPELACSFMSLPFLFGTRLESVPSEVPYLTIPPADRELWAERRRSLGGMAVGLVWAGNKANSVDAIRSVPLRNLEHLGSLPGVSLLSLQKGPGESQLSEARIPIVNWMAECRDLLDTAALIETLDLVVSVDTVVAHVAGALAKPVWLINRAGSEWRWMLHRADSPWYPTMRIFRQASRGDWGDVVGAITADLALTAARR